MPKFLIKYHRSMSTAHNDFEKDAEQIMEFEKKPEPKEVEELLENEFLRMHRKNLKKLLYISYKVNEIIPQTTHTPN